MGAVEEPLSEFRLSALSGEPLRDGPTRAMVESSARALAEREGLFLTELELGAAHVAGRLRADEVAALGFAAELRRLTNAWYERRYRDGPLWGTPAPGE
jgi:hypothetical protein